MGVPTHDQLPIPDYDHLPIGSLGARLRTLDAGQLAALESYERAHGERFPVLQLINKRQAELADGAEPSGGDPAAAQPESPPAPTGHTATSPATSGPPVNPPSQGVPSNPGQPRG